MPRRVQAGRPYFWFYFAAALFLLGLEAFGSGIPHRVRATANDVAAPVLSLLERPIRAMQAGVERIAGVSDIYLENETLREENKRLREWRDAAFQLTRENERLKQIVKAPGREILPLATGRVIGVGGGAFERSILISLGERENVRRHLPVVDGAGLVGRTIEVGYWSTRVLLITDLNSRVPVRLEQGGHLAILAGRNGPEMTLEYLPPDARARLGDMIFTSGHGGIFPPDIPIGRIVSVSDVRIGVVPIGLLDRLDYVKILDYVAPPSGARRPMIAPYPNPAAVGENNQQSVFDGGAEGRPASADISPEPPEEEPGE